MSSLATHVKDVHGVNQESSEHVFHSHDEFLRWKNSEEESTHSNYVTHGGTSVKDSAKYTFFYCNRSGVSKPKGTGARNTDTENIQNGSNLHSTHKA